MSPKLVRVDSDRVSVEGCPLSPENAARLKQILMQYIPWVGTIELHWHSGECFTITFTPTNDIWKVAEVGRERVDEFVSKLLHYTGGSKKETTVSILNFTQRQKGSNAHPQS